MVILTIGASPYLLTRDSKINKDILISCKKAGHSIGSLVLNHDIDYFLPSETGIHTLNHNNEIICKLFPFLKPRGEIAPFTIEVLKQIQPNVLITIGDFADFAYISIIKSQYRSLFKWVAILPFGSIMNETYDTALELVDHIITTTEVGAASIRSICHSSIDCVRYCPNQTEFYPIETNRLEETSAIFNTKNQHSNNPAAFIAAIASSGIRGYLHYNRHDRGDYNIPLLLKRYKVEDRLQIPTKYVSFREGLPQETMNSLYNNHHIVVDCSMQSSTALCLLEGMLAGCVPIGTNYGAVGEIMSEIPPEFRFTLPYHSFIGDKEDKNAIICEKDLSLVFMNLNERRSKDPCWFNEARQASTEVAVNFSKDVFTERVKGIVESVVYKEHAIIVDSFI